MHISVEVICFCEGTAASRGPSLDVYPSACAKCLRRLTSRGSGRRRRRGLVLLQRRNMTWGWARERGREWDSLTGINGSSEVWTENLRMGSNDWTQNGKRQTCFHSPPYTQRDWPIDASFDSEHNRLPLQTGAPAFMRVRASLHSTSGSVRIPFILGRRQMHRGHKSHRRFGTRRWTESQT